MSFLITRPEHDLATRYLSRWSGKVLDVARASGLDVFDLTEKKANQKELTKRISKLNPQFVMFNGHGSDDCVMGHNNEILVQLGKNEDILDSRITYAVSCNSAKKLGKKVGNKNSTYIGYLDDFIFTASNNKSARPLTDNRAKPFMESSNQVAISLLRGFSAKIASEKSKALFRKNYLKLLSSKSDPDAIQDAQFLWWNMRHQACFGNQDAELS